MTALSTLSATLLVTSAWAGQPLAVPSPTADWRGPRVDDVQNRLQRLLKSPAHITAHPRWGTVRTARGERLTASIKPTAQGVLTWLANHPEVFGLADPARSLRLEHALIADRRAGESYFVFKRMHDGLEVVDGTLTVLLDAQGHLRQVAGHYPPSLTLATNPRLTKARAITVARRHAGYRGHDLWFDDSAELVVFTGGENARLAWAVTSAFDRRERLPFHATIYVDAKNGVVLGQRARIYTAGTPAMCTGNDWTGASRNLSCAMQTNGQRLMSDVGTLSSAEITTVNAQNRPTTNLGQAIQGSVQLQADANGAFNHATGVSAHYYVGLAYQYMRTVLMRPSWNHGGGGRDASQVNIVNYGQRYNNAFATTITAGGEQGSLNVFGNGDGQQFLELTRCLDVAGHELFHNVVQSTAGLVYENQSGALNEHFADAFGVAMDKRYEDDDDVIGENCAPMGMPPLRSMSDPSAGSSRQPGHMSEYQTLPNTEMGDHGGVHVNSGIPNKAFYNFYSAQSVEAAEQIWYRALSQGGLTQRAQFIDFVNALITSCGALADMGVCSDLQMALAAVGLRAAAMQDGGGACPANSTEMNGDCVCSNGFRPSTDGSACEMVPRTVCPPNAMQHGEFCYCNDGFVQSAAGDSCIPVRGAPCPPNSRRVGTVCQCEDGFQGDPEAAEGQCTAQVADCGPYEEFDGAQCVCLNGFEVDAMTNECVPGNAGCGDETFFGRCVENRLLVYCDDPDPTVGLVDVVDCADTGMACGADADGFRDCVAAVDPCGTITEAGSCSGTVLTYCDGDGVDRAVFTADCSNYNAECRVDNGTADCFVRGGTPDAGSGGGNGGGNPSAAGPAKKSGCVCHESAPSSTAWVAVLLGAVLLRRRRR